MEKWKVGSFLLLILFLLGGGCEQKQGAEYQGQNGSKEDETGQGWKVNPPLSAVKENDAFKAEEQDGASDSTGSFQFVPEPDEVTDGFDFPVGPPDAKRYYNAQPFGKNLHLGDDWNGTGGGNTDLGDPVYVIANGLVTVAEDAGGGWGNVVRVIHKIDAAPSEYVESLYAHLDTMLVKAGDQLKRGDQLGTIGDADGAYYAHLHFELRTKLWMDLGGGYSEDTTGFTDPTAFIRRNRPE